jgi:hypothetical protein
MFGASCTMQRQGIDRERGICTVVDATYSVFLFLGGFEKYINLFIQVL